MKMKSKLPLIIGGVVVASLLFVGTVFAGRGMISGFGAPATHTPFNTIIFLMPEQVTSPSTTGSVVVNPNPSPSLTQLAVTPLTTTTTTITPATATATLTKPTSTSAYIPSQTQSPSQSCNNVLLPLKAGQQWTYRVTAYGKTSQVLMTVPSASDQQAVVSLVNQTNGISSQSVVDCYNGSLLDFAWTAVGMILDRNLLGGMNVQYVSGVLAPSQTYFTNNNWGIAWSGDYLVSGTTNLTYQSNTYSLTLDKSPMHLVCQTTGTGTAAFESIIVSAGTYTNALKVICSLTVHANIKVSGVSYAGTFTGNTTQWFVPNYGLVKLRADSASLQYLLFNIPLTANSTVELVRH